MNIQYPSLAFAFNPITVNVTNIVGDKVQLTANGITIQRSPIGGTVSFNLAPFAQTLFDRLSFHQVQQTDTTLYKNLSFTIKDIQTTTGEQLTKDQKTGNLDILWGALQIGETYSQSKTLTWFKNYPFTFPLYLTEPITIIAKPDNARYETYGTFSKGKHNLPVTLNANNRLRLRVYGGKASVFDYTFDHTLSPLPPGTFHINLNVNNCTDGIYLRWINKHAEYSYYLFQPSTQSHQVQDTGTDILEYYQTTDYTNHHHIGTNHPQAKKSQQQTKLIAPLVDRETFQFLLTLVESPVVDQFQGYDPNNNPLWIRTNIAPATIAKDQSHLQDFECTLLPPHKQTQQL